MRILVTGGAGFMGSDFIRFVLSEHPEDEVLNYDKLTYAGNLANLASVADNSRYHFVQADICDALAVKRAIQDFQPDVIVNYAAETHVDRSIHDPEAFLRTDVMGTHLLLEAMRASKVSRFLHISTDEVFGSLAEGEASEEYPFRPTSPYSASKAAAEHLIMAYWHTYETPVLITHATNNYGWHHYPEKVIPLFITNLLEGKKVPLYGEGKNVREWLFVRDHSRAVDLVLRKGDLGQSYNIGSGERITNLELTSELLKQLGKGEESIERVKDRPGHDLRYALNSEKLRNLGWKPSYTFQDGIQETVEWYKKNEAWWRPLKSGEYQEYYAKQYGDTKGDSA